MEAKQNRTMKRIIVMINCILLATGATGGPLISRLYFLHGGNSVWLSSFLQGVGFPITFIPLFISYIIRRRQINSTPDSSKLKIFTMKLPLFLYSSIIGVITGLDNYLYSYGVSRLPVSTVALIIASQLAFTAIFAFFMVKQKFTAYSVNAVVLLTFGAGILALHTDGDRPNGESYKTYVMGFVLTLMAAVVYGFLLPLVEFSYSKAKQPITYVLVLEIQMVMSFFASLFCLIGMIISKDYQSISREKMHYGLGEAGYYVVLVGSAILWQFNFLGAVGVIFCSSSLLCGVVIALMVPITQVLAVIFYKEKFNAEKGVSLVLSMWGFVSYFYGEFKQAKKMMKNPTLVDELPQNQSITNP